MIGCELCDIVAASRSRCRLARRRCSPSTAIPHDDRGGALILFPKLALGLSGFETGVAVMPLVRGDPGDTAEETARRGSATRKKLLTTAALIMSVLLIGSSLVTAMLIPARGVRARAGRPTAARSPTSRTGSRRRVRHGLRHQHDRDPVVRRRVGDGRAAQPRAAVSAAVRHGAGMGARDTAARRWSSPPSRFVVTILFGADVDAQGGAYATGVLVLMTRRRWRSTLAAWRERRRCFGYRCSLSSSTRPSSTSSSGRKA